MRKRTSIGLRVLVAFLILSVGPLAFVTATPTHSGMHHSDQTVRNGSEDKAANQITSPATQHMPSSVRMSQIIERSGLDDVSVASVSTTVVNSYSRYDDSDPLENNVRMKIHEAIKQSPGASISEISEQTEIPRSTVRYHIRILEEERLTSSKSHRGKHRLYPIDESNHRLSAALNEDAPATILKAVIQHEPLTVTELSAVVDRSLGTVSYHLNRLADDELVVRSQDGNAITISTPNEVRGIVNKQEISTDDSQASSTGLG
ncbi:winged helix-turn-helix transcriptional regulator [Haladaptatus sp. NG-SE-30]